MATTITTLPAPHELVASAIRFGMPENNRHGFQAVVERWLGLTSNGSTKRSSRAAVKARKVVWKAYGPMRSGSCGQCGGCGEGHSGGGHLNLCKRCFAVLEQSRQHWVPNIDFPSAG